MNTITAHNVHVFVCASACVYLCLQSACLILRSSPIHPLILLTYSPNPVIPGSFFSPSPLSIYPSIPLSLARIPCPPPPDPPTPTGPARLLFLLPVFPPPPPITYPATLHPSIPLDPVSSKPQQMSESLASHAFYLFIYFLSAEISRLPYENAVQGNCTLIAANEAPPNNTAVGSGGN